MGRMGWAQGRETSRMSAAPCVPQAFRRASRRGCGRTLGRSVWPSVLLWVRGRVRPGFLIARSRPRARAGAGARRRSRRRLRRFRLKCSQTTRLRKWEPLNVCQRRSHIGMRTRWTLGRAPETRHRCSTTLLISVDCLRRLGDVVRQIQWCERLLKR